MTETKTTVGVVAESESDERRVALVPKAITTLVNSGVAVVVESGAGDADLLPDDLYTAAGATIACAFLSSPRMLYTSPRIESSGALTPLARALAMTSSALNLMLSDRRARTTPLVVSLDTITPRAKWELGGSGGATLRS